MSSKTGFKRIPHSKGKQIGKECLRCQKHFFVPEWRHKEGKGKYCSRSCRKSPVYDLVCSFCGNSFQEKREDAKFCSSKCFGLSRKKRIKTTCAFCGKGIEKIPSQHQEGNNFCSLSCSVSSGNKQRAKMVEVSCEGCGAIREYSVYKENSGVIDKYCSKKCYAKHQRDRLVDQCRHIAVEHKETISQKAIQRYKTQDHPWVGKKHKQSTKEKISKKAKKRFLDPENNPMYGKKHSQESKEKMSETRSKKWISGEYENPKKTWEQGHHFSEKMGKNFFYRSSWEREYFRYLDGCDNVAWYEVESIRIPYFYKQKRWYIPDILVKYINDNEELVEIKPFCYRNSEKNKLKFAAAREYCKQNNMRFRVLTEKYLKYVGCL